MGKDEQLLQRAVEEHKARKIETTAKVGDIAQTFFTNWISPRQARFGNVTELWDQLLPGELSRHCEIVDISSGKLKVRADSPAYRYELQLCSSELLKELQQQCPKARIKEIKVVLS